MSDTQQSERVQALRNAPAPRGPLALEGPHGALDIFLNFPDIHQRVLADLLLPEIDGDRTRQRTAASLAAAIPTLGMVVANALSAVGADSNATAIYYSRHNGAYSGKAPYSPPWLGWKLLRGVIDNLTAAGLLDGKVSTGIPGSPRSTLWPTPKLITVLAKAGISQADICVEQTAPVLILRDSQKRLVSYDPSDPTVSAAATAVRTYNEFLSHQTLSLDAPEGLVGVTGDLKARMLRRIYNEASWSLGGRFYGGGWQDLPKELRPYIRINRSTTVELDFEGFMPRAAYHLVGIDYRQDPYDIPAFRQACEEDGITHNDGRSCVKTVLMWMLNGRSSKGIPKDVGELTLPRGMTVKALRQLIASHHAPIAGSFFTAMSLRIMNRDSEVCAGVLADGVRDNLPVLPIHDSFLVPEDHIDWLRDSMTRHYRTEFGFDPVIRLEG